MKNELHLTLFIRSFNKLVHSLITSSQCDTINHSSLLPAPSMCHRGRRSDAHTFDAAEGKEINLLTCSSHLLGNDSSAMLQKGNEKKTFCLFAFCVEGLTTIFYRNHI